MLHSLFSRRFTSIPFRIAIACWLLLALFACSPQQDSGTVTDPLQSADELRLDADRDGHKVTASESEQDPLQSADELRLDADRDGHKVTASESEQDPLQSADELRLDADRDGHKVTASESEQDQENNESVGSGTGYESIFREPIAALRAIESFHFTESRHKNIHGGLFLSNSYSFGVAQPPNAVRKSVRISTTESDQSFEYARTSGGEFLRSNPTEPWVNVENDALEPRLQNLLRSQEVGIHPIEAMERALDQLHWEQEFSYFNELSIATTFSPA